MSPARNKVSNGVRIDSASSLRVGCLGLAANPPHRGHIEHARILLGSGWVDEVWLIPVFRHAFEKSDMAPWEHRVNMCRMLGGEDIRVLDIEGERGGISYTIDTLKCLKRRYPGHIFYWCVGYDIVTSGSYLKWHRWKEMKNNFQFLLVERPGYPLQDIEIPKVFIEAGTSLGDPISSTDIRQMVRGGKDITPHVGKKVARYIREHKLYKEV